MSLVVAVAADRVRVPLPAPRVTAIARGVLRAERVGDALLSVTFVSRAAIRRMNRVHLGRDLATDVIAFAFRPLPVRRRKGSATAGKAVVGDVYIAPDVAATSAKAAGISVGEELTRLVVHGTLHALGYEHPETGDRTRSAMWKKQERLVARFRRAR